MVFSVFPIFNLFLLFHHGFGQLDIGNRCTIKNTDLEGECKLLSLCLQAKDSLKQHVYPQICGFQGNEPIVCCLQGTTISRTTQPPQNLTDFGAKSRQKCIEYQQYAHGQQDVPAGLHRDNQCPLVFTNLILGGIEAKPRELPHMVLIGFNGENNDILWNCDGTLISDTYVLASAHCMYDPYWGEPRHVRVGGLQDGAQIQDFTIIEKIRHPNFVPPTIYNDIALLKLNKSVRLNPYARPACLNTNANIPISKAEASGWSEEFYGKDTKRLIKVTLDTFTNAECNNIYRNVFGKRLRNGIVDELQLCAGLKSGGADICQMLDGILQIIHPDSNIYCMHSIIGINSFGTGCGSNRVYTRVSSYVNWIESVVWP